MAITNAIKAMTPTMATKVRFAPDRLMAVTSKGVGSGIRGVLLRLGAHARHACWRLAYRAVHRRPQRRSPTGNGPVRLLILSIGSARYPRLATSLDRAKSNHMWHWFPHLRATRTTLARRESTDKPKSGAADDNEGDHRRAGAAGAGRGVHPGDRVEQPGRLRVVALPRAHSGDQCRRVLDRRRGRGPDPGRLGHVARGPPPPASATPRAEVGRHRPRPRSPSVDAGPGRSRSVPATGRTSTLDLDRPPPPASERQALLDEVDRVSPDDAAK